MWVGWIQWEEGVPAVAIVSIDLRDIESLDAEFQSMEVATLSSAAGFELHISLQPVGLLFLEGAVVHPLRLLVAVEAVDLERNTAVAYRA